MNISTEEVSCRKESGLKDPVESKTKLEGRDVPCPKREGTSSVLLHVSSTRGVLA